MHFPENEATFLWVHCVNRIVFMFQFTASQVGPGSGQNKSRLTNFHDNNCLLSCHYRKLWAAVGFFHRKMKNKRNKKQNYLQWSDREPKYSLLQLINKKKIKLRVRREWLHSWTTLTWSSLYIWPDLCSKTILIALMNSWASVKVYHRRSQF